MAVTMGSRLVADALAMAVAGRRPGAGLSAHSDRGSQYAGDRHRRAPAVEGIVCRTSGVGPCRDNAPVESLFGSPKRELRPDEVFATRDRPRAEIFEYREASYNRVRRHSSPGFLSPEAFERARNRIHP